MMKATIPPDSIFPEVDDRSVAQGYQVVVCTTDGVSAVPLMEGKPYGIGRGTLNDIVVAHDSVSRNHALIHGGDPPILEELGSRNGTRIDGRRLSPGERVRLHPGMAIQIGPATLVIHNGQFAIDRARKSHGNGVSILPPSLMGAPTVLSSDLVLRDERMLALYRTVEAVAAADISVLILGETGVGKELLAQAIHSLSARRTHPFVKFNSAALPDSLVESELFGYERGAFTGADKTKAGLFEAADGGTLFLDEVGDLTLPAQAKLLRVLETGEILRVGAVKPKKVDVRFISATNRDLRTLIAGGNFRKDLFYRLNGVNLHIPPLRRRMSDIEPLVEFFAERSARQIGKPKPMFTLEAMSKLCAYRWPGNVRELRNVIERAVLLTRDGSVLPEILQLDANTEPGGPYSSSNQIPIAAPTRDSAAMPVSFEFDEAATRVMNADKAPEGLVDKLRSELAKQERTRILAALAKASGNQTIAASLLGISRRTLLNRLDEYAIPRPRKGRARES
jgi:two-component system response regulator AtoC